MLAEHGTRGVTHRAVSEAAGASLGLTRYWFDSREQLLEAALRHLAERDVATMTAALEAVLKDATRENLPRRAAAVLAAQLETDRVRALARYELFLEAARRPGLADALREWGEAYRKLIGRLLHAAGCEANDVRATLVLDAVNGLQLEQLAAPRPDFAVAVLEPALAQLLRAPAPGLPTRPRSSRRRAAAPSR